jgi:putative nucleotidyltransferase with HDIG domain
MEWIPQMTALLNRWGSHMNSTRATLTRRSRNLALIFVYLGLFQLLTGLVAWRFSDISRFLLYLALVGVCWLVQRKSSSRNLSIPFSLPVVLLAVVELSTAEAVMVGCLAALLQTAHGVSAKGGLLRCLYYVGAQAMMLASVRFTLDSLLPSAWTNVSVRLMVTAVALFVANTFPSAMVARLNEGQRIGKIWRDSYLWALPYYFVAAALAHLMRLGPTGMSWEVLLLALPVLLLVSRHYRAQKTLLESESKRAGEVAALHLRAIEGLALAVEARDNPNTTGHLRRVQVYALGLGRAMGLNGDELEALHAASLLHDIGKLAVPDHILTKPGRLTPEEFARLKVHPLVGAEIVEQVQFPYPVAALVRAHHEKWDGSGYPFGLKGDEIPLGARILTAVDCLDALSSDREYRKGISLEEAMEHLKQESGRSFDADVVRVLEGKWRELDLEARQSVNHPLLSTAARIENGIAPDAGLDLHSGASWEGARFLSTIAAARKEEQQLRNLATGIGKSLELQETLHRLHDLLQGMLHYDAVAFFIHRANALRVEFASGVTESMLFSLDIAVGDGLTGWVALRQQAVVNGNPEVDPGFVADPQAPLLSALSIPLSGRGGLVAVLNLYRAQKDAFSRDDLRILTAIAPNIATAVEHALQYRNIELLASKDPLTGLPNEDQLLRLAKEELSRSQRTQVPLAVASMRLSGPAYPPGQHGSKEALCAVGQALRQECRDYDHVAYIRPNTFAFVLPGMKPSVLSSKLAELAAAAQSACPEMESPVTFSGGGAFFPDDGDSAQQLLMLACRRATAAVQPATAIRQRTRSIQALDKAVTSSGQEAETAVVEPRH